MAAARRAHEAWQRLKESRADSFRLARPGRAGEPVIGWIEGHVGDADDDPRQPGRRQVRDTAAESVEVLVLVRRDDGMLVTPPCLRQGGGREVPTEHEPPADLARTIATCTLALPIQLCDLAAIDELERMNAFPAWQESRWLAGELVLVLDERGETNLHGHHLRYERRDGLIVTRTTPATRTKPPRTVEHIGARPE